LAPVVVSNVEIEQQSFSFDVDQTDVPVLVRIGYFPNWKASGADGPYRVGPNMMVVVPRSTHVELNYGHTKVDWITIMLTLAGIALCFFWRYRGDVRHAAEVPVAFARAGGDPQDTDVPTDASTDGFDDAFSGGGTAPRPPPFPAPSADSWFEPGPDAPRWSGSADPTDPGGSEPPGAAG